MEEQCRYKIEIDFMLEKPSLRLKKGGKINRYILSRLKNDLLVVL